MQHFNALNIANWLVHQHANQTPVSALPKDMALSNARQAVAVQNEFVRLKAQQCGDVVGWKIAVALYLASHLAMPINAKTVVMF